MKNCAKDQTVNLLYTREGKFDSFLNFVSVPPQVESNVDDELQQLKDHDHSNAEVQAEGSTEGPKQTFHLQTKITDKIR